MKLHQILVLKETREGEGRVALTPSAAAALVAKNYHVMIENNAGLLAGFKDEEYIQRGASIYN